MFVDKQTLDDLNIFGRRGRGSICGIFGATRTRGGAALLEEFFRQPLASAEEINERSSTIARFAEHPEPFPYNGETLDCVEFYMQDTDERSLLNVEDNTLGQRVKGALGGDTHYDNIRKGVIAVRQLLGISEKESNKLSFDEIAKLDRQYRFKERDSILSRLYEAYKLDVYMTAAKISADRGFTMAQVVVDKEDYTLLEIDEMFHPSVPGAVPCSVSMDSKNNIFFLTGANMAGKSTFMKTLSVTVFLAHCGFPIPAKAMRFTVLQGLFTTINLPDNLNAGYSHFYTEVLRVKRVAQQLLRTPRMLIIFDEMFRGTNVKDAYDATLAITRSIIKRENCFFVISTHIIEAGEVLRSENCPRVNYWYMPTVMEGNVPRYTYKLTQGITDDRHGMVIIRNEKILDKLNEPSLSRTNEGKDFLVDQQTLEDLNILGEFKAGSIFSLFNHTITREGKRRLEMMLRKPLTEVNAIRQRTEIFRFIQGQDIVFPISREDFNALDQFQSFSLPDSAIARALYLKRLKLMHIAGVEHSYLLLDAGLKAFDKLVNNLKPITQKLLSSNPPAQCVADLKELDRIIKLPTLTASQREFVLDRLYDLDAWVSVASTAKAHGFNYAEAVESDSTILKVNGFRHPNLDKGTTNNLSLTSEQNVLFLTGANMAGKSTLMKSYALSAYMAQCGLPIAAESMTFTPIEGIFTSINVPDNIAQGYSHYYAEVLRVKFVAEKVASGAKLLVLFDELFKGTNVKDAHEATVAVTRAFSCHNTSTFIISTHILEAAEELKQEHGSSTDINFSFMPTEVDEKGRPHYPYHLTTGITADRHGMIIIRQEGILEMLEQ